MSWYLSATAVSTARCVARGLAWAVVAVAAATAVTAHAEAEPWADAACPPRLTALFAPPVRLPGAGRADTDETTAVRYEVCRSSRPFDAVRPPDWPVEVLTASETFAGLSPAVRRPLERLYRGSRLRVARGWREGGTAIDAITLIAPAPAETLDRVLPGTLVIHARYGSHSGRGGGATGAVGTL